MMTKSIRQWKVSRRRRDEQLSAYLDDQLSAGERMRLEAQLAGDPELRAELAALRATVSLVREMPSVPVPRNFILPQATARRPRDLARARLRLARAAPLLTAATTVVALLFVVALGGNLLLPATGRSMYASPPEPQMLEAPEAAVEVTVLVEVEAAVESEAPAPAEPAAEPTEAPVEAAEEPQEEPVPVEEAALEGEGVAREVAEPEEEPAWTPTEEAREAVIEAEEEPVALPEPPLGADVSAQQDGERAPAQAAPGTEVAAEALVPRDATAEWAMQMLSGTVSAEKAVGAGGPDMPPPPAADARSTPSPTPRPTLVVEPLPEPTEGAEPVSAEEDEAAPRQDETESPPAIELTELPPPEREEEAAADLLEVDREWRETARAPAAFPWGAIQIGLGTTAIVLLVATVWAWRLRH